MYAIQFGLTVVPGCAVRVRQVRPELDEVRLHRTSEILRRANQVNSAQVNLGE